jgi:hypothetical protein
MVAVAELEAGMISTRTKPLWLRPRPEAKSWVVPGLAAIFSICFGLGVRQLAGLSEAIAD